MPLFQLRQLYQLTWGAVIVIVVELLSCEPLMGGVDGVLLTGGGWMANLEA